jgi:anti-sigma-K factor RskA
VKIVPATTVNGAQVSFVSSKSLNKALFVNNNLPSPGDRLTYQLWTLKGRDATADNLIDAGLRRQWFKNSIADSTGLAVTIEPETGSVVPTTPVQANAAI